MFTCPSERKREGRIRDATREVVEPDHGTVAHQRPVAYPGRLNNSSMPITVWLADDAASVGTVIKNLLKVEPGMTVVGEAANFPETVAMCAQLKPNVLLLASHPRRSC